MNIFHVHKDPVLAAQMMCDKHVVKMILESAQMLATVNHKCGKKATYKPTHANHPSTLWAGKSKSNYNWLKSHGIALCHEYTHRYKKVHKSEQYFLTEFDCPDTIPELGLTEFAQAMPDEYKDSDPVLAYRKYYLGAKKEFAKWTNRDIPAWFDYSNPILEV